MTTIVSRGQARDMGLTRYFTGKPCLRGHSSERMVSNKNCVECLRVSRKIFYHSDIEHGRQVGRSYYHTHSDQQKESAKKYKLQNREKIYQRGREWLARNPDRYVKYKENVLKRYEKKKDVILEYAKEWRANNQDRCALHHGLRRSRLLDATPDVPEYLKETFEAELLAIYKERRQLRKATCESYHVDHIFPISKGGVHAPWNLRVITKNENLKKKDKWPINEELEVMWHGLLVSRVTINKQLERRIDVPYPLDGDLPHGPSKES